MTWFVSTSDIIGAIVFVPLIWFAVSVLTAGKIAEKMGVRNSPWALLAIFIGTLAAYGVPIVYIGWSILT